MRRGRELEGEAPRRGQGSRLPRAALLAGILLALGASSAARAQVELICPEGAPRLAPEQGGAPSFEVDDDGGIRWLSPRGSLEADGRVLFRVGPAQAGPGQAAAPPSAPEADPAAPPAMPQLWIVRAELVLETAPERAELLACGPARVGGTVALRLSPDQRLSRRLLRLTIYRSLTDEEQPRWVALGEAQGRTLESPRLGATMAQLTLSRLLGDRLGQLEALLAGRRRRAAHDLLTQIGTELAARSSGPPCREPFGAATCDALGEALARVTAAGRSLSALLAGCPADAALACPVPSPGAPEAV